ncbi:hypothetical protein J5N97_014585 [Dioscorea zingiberensis]|uniref:Uncharacterized protein n=1 Tax=Dioscorea zingiberensis TaxID=325984 RepID=A0A9D5HJV0_9LILI|nr:hypothetical protein J5N97_014585 [Dioscorea zingiberensis]
MSNQAERAEPGDIEKLNEEKIEKVLQRFMGYPEIFMNCVHPGFVKTNINWNTGVMSTEEGLRGQSC